MNYTKALFDLLPEFSRVSAIEELTSLNNEQLTYGKPSKQYGQDSDFMKGQYAHDTCSKEFVLRKLVPMYKGNLDFWLGYMRAAYLSSI